MLIKESSFLCLPANKIFFSNCLQTNFKFFLSSKFSLPRITVKTGNGKHCNGKIFLWFFKDFLNIVFYWIHFLYFYLKQTKIYVTSKKYNSKNNLYFIILWLLKLNINIWKIYINRYSYLSYEQYHIIKLQKSI